MIINLLSHHKMTKGKLIVSSIELRIALDLGFVAVGIQIELKTNGATPR